MNNLLEEFINIALEAFTNASGDADKFELQLRRKLMTYSSTMNTTPQMANNIISTTNNIPQIGITQVEKALSNINDNDPIFAELENLDVHNMSDQDVLEFAKRLGIMGGVEEDVVNEQEDE